MRSVQGGWLGVATRRGSLVRASLAALLGALGAAGTAAAGGAPAAARPAESAPATQAWLEGDAARAARELEGQTDREGVLNRGVALLYAGDAATAERELSALYAREPGWTPALRWLARARAASGSPERDATLAALLAAPGASGSDLLWAGRLQKDAGRLDRAAASLRAATQRDRYLYLAWLWLGDVEEARGRPDAAREAWLEARELHVGGDVLYRLGASSLRAGRADEARRWLEQALATPEGREREAEIRALAPDLAAAPEPLRVAPPLWPGERLTYTARYLFFRFATVEIENQGFTEVHGRRATRFVARMRSKPGFPFLSIDSRFESLIGDDGRVLAHRNSSRDSTEAPRQAAYDMDPATGECVAREVVEGLFGFERFPLAPLDQDGLSIFVAARALAASGASLSVLTAMDSTWKGTELRTRGVERIRWAGGDVDAVEVEAVGHYRGTAGFSGRLRTWISRDGRAVPYKASLKVALGSVVLDLRDDSLQRADRRRPGDPDDDL